jgi:mono/diheme cytochrome c family protein
VVVSSPSLSCETVATSETAETKASVWDGVYSDHQATRGKVVFSEVCSACHGVDLRGDSNTPSVVGMSFMFLWEGRSLAELFDKIVTEMPPTNPNSLAGEDYRDALAYLMKKNGFPAGSEGLSDLPGDSARIFIMPRP